MLSGSPVSSCKLVERDPPMFFKSFSLCTIEYCFENKYSYMSGQNNSLLSRDGTDLSKCHRLILTSSNVSHSLRSTPAEKLIKESPIPSSVALTSLESDFSNSIPYCVSLNTSGNSTGLVVFKHSDKETFLKQIREKLTRWAPTMGARIILDSLKCIDDTMISCEVLKICFEFDLLNKVTVRDAVAKISRQLNAEHNRLLSLMSLSTQSSFSDGSANVTPTWVHLSTMGSPSFRTDTIESSSTQSSCLLSPLDSINTTCKSVPVSSRILSHRLSLLSSNVNRISGLPPTTSARGVPSTSRQIDSQSVPLNFSIIQKRRLHEALYKRMSNMIHARFDESADSLYRQFLNVPILNSGASLNGHVSLLLNDGLYKLMDLNGNVVYENMLTLQQFLEQIKKLKILLNDTDLLAKCREILREEFECFRSWRSNHRRFEDLIAPESEFRHQSKADNHLHVGGSIRGNVIVSTIKQYLNSDDVVIIKNGRGLTLKQLFDLKGISTKNITMKSLRVMADERFQRNFTLFNTSFDVFNDQDINSALFDKCGPLNGMILATMIREELRLRIQSGVYSEMRISCHGKSLSELDSIAQFFEKYPDLLLSEHIKWVLQCPRRSHQLIDKGNVQSFENIIQNFFQPIIYSSLYPGLNKPIDTFLRSVIGVDLVDREDVETIPSMHLTPSAMTDKDLPVEYAAYSFYFYSALDVVNFVRSENGLNCFSLIPHVMECDLITLNAITSFLLSSRVCHGRSLHSTWMFNFSDLYELAFKSIKQSYARTLYAKSTAEETTGVSKLRLNYRENRLHNLLAALFS